MLPSGPSNVVKAAAHHPEKKAAMEASFPGQELCGRRPRQKQSQWLQARSGMAKEKSCMASTDASRTWTKSVYKTQCVSPQGRIWHCQPNQTRRSPKSQHRSHIVSRMFCRSDCLINKMPFHSQHWCTRCYPVSRFTFTHCSQCPHCKGMSK